MYYVFQSIQCKLLTFKSTLQNILDYVSLFHSEYQVTLHTYYRPHIIFTIEIIAYVIYWGIVTFLQLRR